MSEAAVPARHVRIGRILHEDDGFLTIEIPKQEHRKLRIENGDRFLSMIFIHQNDGAMETWIPWDKDDDGL